MAVLDFAHREITAKVVYFGAPNAGVSTNVEKLCERAAPETGSELLRFAPDVAAASSVCFEYTALDYAVRAFPLRVQVYGVPGGVHHPRMRSQILDGLDAVVFVADARPGREQANIDSLLELEHVLEAHGHALATLPLVLQINHTDAPQARPASAVAVDLNPYGFPVHSAVAHADEGVQETHAALLTLLRRRLENALSGSGSNVALRAERPERRMSLSEQVQAMIADFHTATVRAARAADPRERYKTLPISQTFAVAYQPASLRGTRPLTLLDARLKGEDVVLDLVHERLNGGDPKRLQIVLENRPIDQIGLARAAAHAMPALPLEDVTSNLPSSLRDPTPAPATANDLPPVAYGVIGVAFGVLLGLLLGIALLY